jgi:hypothetical protein
MLENAEIPTKIMVCKPLERVSLKSSLSFRPQMFEWLSGSPFSYLAAST